MNKEETAKLANDIRKIVWSDNIVEEKCNGDILWHILVINKFWGREFLDRNKNHIRILPHNITISFEAWINPNGIWDWKEPDIAITYSIGFWINCMRKDYRKRQEYQTEYVKFYWYSRERDNIVSRFKEFYNKIINIDIDNIKNI